MLGKKFLTLLCVLAWSGSSFAVAQTPQGSPAQEQTTTASVSTPDGGVPHYIKPETPEQRRERLATPEDPGPNPDPNKHFIRFGRSYHIEKYDRRWENYEGVEPGYVRPFGFVNVQKEIYQINDKWVWVWMNDPVPEDFQPPPVAPRYSDEQLRYFETMRSLFYALTPKASDQTIRFEESSEGLPTSGSWRNSLAVADMNGDGCPDIVTPPERQGNGVPVIFLGDCKGHWKQWTDAQWPMRLDYGSVAAADFNKDGHMDLAFGIHHQGVAIMFGDGKGKFTMAGYASNFSTRRVRAIDVDHDGYPDVVALNEGAAAQGSTPESKIRVLLNRKKGTTWEALDVAGPDRQVAGDWLTVAHLKGERDPDFIASTIYLNSNDTIFLNDGLRKWQSFGASGELLPRLGYYYANAAGKFTSKKRDDAIVSYVQYWPQDLDTKTMPDPPLKTIVGIDRISFAGKAPKRTPIARWAGNRSVLGLAVGDFNGDGNLDIAYTRYDPRELVILLGDGKGGFTQAKVEGVKLAPATNYDLTVADVNGDGRPDLILMYEATEAGSSFAPRNGSIQVFLNRGPAPAKGEPAKTAAK